jgi:tetratricopeptide (TPR) repeat protein
VNDRYLYLAVTGAGILAAAGLARRPARSIQLAGMGVLLLLAVLTGLRCLDWRDGERLWQSTLSVNPLSVKARIGLSRFHFNEGRTDLALERAREAADLTAPGTSMNADARMLMAQSLNRMGRPRAAAEQLRRALLEADARGESRTFSHRLKTMSENLWALEMKAKRYEDALHAAQMQVKLAGETAIGLLLQAQALRRLGRTEEAEARLRKAAALDSDCAEVHLELAELLEEAGRNDEARTEREKGLNAR